MSLFIWVTFHKSFEGNLQNSSFYSGSFMFLLCSILHSWVWSKGQRFWQICATKWVALDFLMHENMQPKLLSQFWYRFLRRTFKKKKAKDKISLPILVWWKIAWRVKYVCEFSLSYLGPRTSLWWFFCLSHFL